MNTSHAGMSGGLADMCGILCLGDSISYGGGGSATAGFRGPLWTLLAAEPRRYGMVGPSILNTTTLPAGQYGHGGFASYGTRDLTANLDGLDTWVHDTYGGAERDPGAGSWLSAAPVLPGAVCSLVGANDIIYSDAARAFFDLETYFAVNAQALVDKVRLLAPRARVLLAKITPYAGKDDAVAFINAAVAVTTGVHRVVDLNTSFPPGETVDGVHPTDIGYAWMATQWHEAITS